MATKRKDGWVVVQMLLRDDEYEQVFMPLREVAGFGEQTESAFLRARCGLSAPAPRTASTEVSAGTSPRKSATTKQRTKAKKYGRKRGAQTKHIRQNKGSRQRPSSAGKTDYLVPFVGHIEHNEEIADEETERPSEAHSPSVPEDEVGERGAEMNAKIPLDFSEELSILADILPVDSSQHKPE